MIPMNISEVTICWTPSGKTGEPPRHNIQGVPHSIPEGARSVCGNPAALRPLSS